MRLALVTVTSSGYVWGTFALFNSFLKHNNWFRGTLVCIDYNLDEADKVKLRKFSPIFVKPSKALNDICINSNQSNISNVARLLDFEAFRIAQSFDRLLYLDSDMLVIGNIQELFNLRTNCACVDSCILKGKRRRIGDYHSLPFISSNNTSVLSSTVNTGMMLLQPDASLQYDKLIYSAATFPFASSPENLIDEPIVNQVISNFFSTVSCIYNYRIHLEMEHYLFEGIKYSDAKIIHFTGKNKPWKPLSFLILSLRHSKYVKFLIAWLKFIR